MLSTADAAIAENKPNRSEPSNPNHNLEAALNFLEIHPEAALFPSKYISERKSHIGLVKWSKESSSDPEQIKRWARKWPEAYFCVNLKASNLTVLDIDNKNEKQGSKSLEALELIYGDLPETGLTETPSGGLHYLFSEWCGKQSSDQLGRGVDTPTMTPVPDSIVPGKGMYKIKKTGPIAPLPEWIAKNVGEVKKRTKKHKTPAVTEDMAHNVDNAIEYAKHADPAVENDSGNNQTYLTACGVRDFGVSRETCLMIMAEHYNPICEPPWKYGELKRIVIQCLRIRPVTGRREPAGGRICRGSDPDGRNGSGTGKLSTTVTSQAAVGRISAGTSSPVDSADD